MLGFAEFYLRQKRLYAIVGDELFFLEKLSYRCNIELPLQLCHYF